MSINIIVRLPHGDVVMELLEPTEYHVTIASMDRTTPMPIEKTFVWDGITHEHGRRVYMSTDDRLTMALYRAEQDEATWRKAFDDDMKFIFQKTVTCEHEHGPLPAGPSRTFCKQCLDDLHAVILTRDAVAAPSFILSEVDICALLRQLHRGPIPHDGQSGPRVHALHKRLVAAIGYARYEEFVDGEWPKRFK